MAKALSTDAAQVRFLSIVDPQMLPKGCPEMNGLYLNTCSWPTLLRQSDWQDHFTSLELICHTDNRSTSSCPHEYTQCGVYGCPCH